MGMGPEVRDLMRKMIESFLGKAIPHGAEILKKLEKSATLEEPVLLTKKEVSTLHLLYTTAEQFYLDAIRDLSRATPPAPEEGDEGTRPSSTQTSSDDQQAPEPHTAE